MSEWGKIKGSSRSFTFDNIKLTPEQHNRIIAEENAKELERKRLGIPGPFLYSSDDESIYSKYEEEAELYIAAGKKLPENLEKLLLDTKEERLKGHKESIDCTLSDEYIIEKYGIKL